MGGKLTFSAAGNLTWKSYTVFEASKLRVSTRNLLVIGATLLLGACFSGKVHDETLDGPYALSAVDVMRQMSVCRGVGDTCVVEVDSTVIAVGFDRDYVVAARRPWSAFENITNGGVVEYYYIIRRRDETEKGPKEVVGPLTQVEFESAKGKLHLPSFSRYFTEEELSD